MFDATTIFCKILLRTVTKQPWGTGTVICTEILLLEFRHLVVEERCGGWTVREVCPQTTWLHDLEPKRERALGLPVLDGIVGLVQGRGAGRAVVINIDDRDVGQAEVVQSTLCDEVLIEDGTVWKDGLKLVLGRSWNRRNSSRHRRSLSHRTLCLAKPFDN